MLAPNVQVTFVFVINFRQTSNFVRQTAVVALISSLSKNRY